MTLFAALTKPLTVVPPVELSFISTFLPADTLPLAVTFVPSFPVLFIVISVLPVVNTLEVTLRPFSPVFIKLIFALLPDTVSLTLKPPAPLFVTVNLLSLFVTVPLISIPFVPVSVFKMLPSP